jgi:hypothetical protein
LEGGEKGTLGAFAVDFLEGDVDRLDDDDCCVGCNDLESDSKREFSATGGDGYTGSFLDADLFGELFLEVGAVDDESESAFVMLLVVIVSMGNKRKKNLEDAGDLHLFCLFLHIELN